MLTAHKNNSPVMNCKVFFIKMEIHAITRKRRSKLCEGADTDVGTKFNLHATGQECLWRRLEKKKAGNEEWILCVRPT